jgi:hypothetical protein
LFKKLSTSSTTMINNSPKRVRLID